jgi:hypothetical protein
VLAGLRIVTDHRERVRWCDARFSVAPASERAAIDAKVSVWWLDANGRFHPSRVNRASGRGSRFGCAP